MTLPLTARLAIGFALASGLGLSAAQARTLDEDGMIAATPSVRADADRKAESASDEETLGKKVGDYLSQVHGEVGVAVGTNDMHAIYGTAVLPLGEESTLTLSFEQSRNAYYGPFYNSVFGIGPLYDGRPHRVR